MRRFRHLVLATLVIFQIALENFAFSHEGLHKEDSESSYTTDDESNDKTLLPVRSSRRQNILPKPPLEDSYSRRETRNRPSKNPFAVGFFVSFDLPMITNSEDALSTTTNTQSGTVHHSGDQHKALDGHDHHHGIIGRSAVFRCPSGSRCHGGEDHSAPTQDGSGQNGASSSVLTPVATVKSGYAFSREVSLGLNVSTDFSSGLKDPTVGPSLLFPIGSRYKGMLSLLAAIPLSSTSRENAKITTLTGSINTLYHSHDGFFAGGGLLVAGSFYGSADSNPSSPTSSSRSAVRYHNGEMPSQTHTETEQTNALHAEGVGVSNPLELVRTGGSLFTGLMLSDRVSANLSLGIGTTYKDDQSFGWLSDVTVARLGYSLDGFTGAVAFSFLSDPKGSETIPFPSEPFIGLKIQYIFGALSTLGIVGTDSVGH